MKLFYKTEIVPTKISDVIIDFYKKKCPETFLDKDLLDSQCQEHRRRSPDDLIAICNAFFENTTIEDVLIGIHEYNSSLIKGNSLIGPFVYFGYCGTIRKPVGIMYDGYSYFLSDIKNVCVKSNSNIFLIKASFANDDPRTESEFHKSDVVAVVKKISELFKQEEKPKMFENLASR